MYKVPVPEDWAYKPTPYMLRELTFDNLARISAQDRETQWILVQVMNKAEARATPKPPPERTRAAKPNPKANRPRASWVTP